MFYTNILSTKDVNSSIFQAICHAMNSHLVEIETAEEDNFIRTTLRSFQVTRKGKHVYSLLNFHLLVH
jgi:hypothetical protein